MSVNSLEKYAAKQSLKELLSQSVYGAKPSILGGTLDGVGTGITAGGLLGGGLGIGLAKQQRVPLTSWAGEGLLALGGMGGVGVGAIGGGLTGLLRSIRAKKGWVTRRDRINKRLALAAGGGAGLAGLAGLISANK